MGVVRVGISGVTRVTRVGISGVAIVLAFLTLVFKPHYIRNVYT